MPIVVNLEKLQVPNCPFIRYRKQDIPVFNSVEESRGFPNSKLPTIYCYEVPR